MHFHYFLLNMKFISQLAVAAIVAVPVIANYDNYSASISLNLS
jgi:hypothetical protein